MNLLSHGKVVSAILKVLLERLEKSQNQVRFETGIPKHRLSDLVNDRKNPEPDEITVLDKALKQNRRLVLNYCSSICPAGKYAGYQFTDMDANAAGMRLISTLFTLQDMIPKIADMLTDGKVTPDILAKLSQLRLSIMALEVHLASEEKLSCCSADIEALLKIGHKKMPPEEAANC